jgi:predicted amidohydrolase
MKIVVVLFCCIMHILILAVVSPAKSQSRKKVKIAMCQIFCLDSDPDGNFVRIENAISEAKEKGAEIVCFPETSILGWVNPNAHKMASTVPGDFSNRLTKLAVKYQIYISIGLAEKVNENLCDSVVLIDEKGTILLKHRKINILTELMDPPYTPGTDVKVVETRFGKIGMLICADTFKQKVLKKMADLKPDLLIVPYGWVAKVEEWPEHGKTLVDVVTKTAKKVDAPVIGTDVVGQISNGPWTGRTYGGQSVAADKAGRVLAICKDRDRDVKIITVEL